MSGSILPCQLEGISWHAGGRVLLDRISLRLEAGLRTVILGPNGSGKSLLLRVAHGLLQPTSGRVVWSGTALNGHQAMVFQRPVLLRRSAAANIDHALSLRGVKGPERERRRNEVLERTGLAHLAHQPARALSGGEQQRLALARAWAVRPEVLFLDEPTSSLDPTASRGVEEVVQALHEAGTKIVMSTHDLGQARRLADEVVFLYGGRLVEAAPAAGFFESPKSAEARDFLAGNLIG